MEPKLYEKYVEDGTLRIEWRDFPYRGQESVNAAVAARLRLVVLIQQALVKPRNRRKTKPTSGARERRLSGKKLRGTVKEGRRRREQDD